MTVLADTSVWVQFLRRGRTGPAADLDGLLDRGEVVMCGPVVAELLAGARDADRDELWRLFSGLPWSDLSRSAWGRVGETAAGLRALGETVVLTDVEIAVAADEARARLWTLDSDFDRVRRVMPDLELYP